MAGEIGLTDLLRLLSDPTRLRILSVLSGNELTVKELTEILLLGQSTLSTQLGQLKEAGLVTSRKENQYMYYRLSRFDEGGFTQDLVNKILAESEALDWHSRDQRRLAETLEKRRDASLSYFNGLKVQNQISPGQTWEALAKGLAGLLRSQEIVDLGCGLGRLSALFARFGNRVTGIDNSAEQIANAEKLNAASLGPNLRFLCRPMEDSGLEPESFDIALISHALHHAARPPVVIKEAGRLLKPGGKLLLLDLNSHQEEWLKDKFADFWLGFDPEDLQTWMKQAGFQETDLQFGAPDRDYPNIETLIAVGIRKS